MSNWNRHMLVWGAPLAAMLAVAAILSLRAPLPTIAQGLSGSYADAGAEFDRRVRAAFAVGTSEHAMMETLSKAGFNLTATNGFASARFERAGLFCRTLWIVYANADAAGRITVTEGNYGVNCIAPPQIERYVRR